MTDATPLVKGGLKPCPFCESKDVWSLSRKAIRGWRSYWEVTCEVCECSGPPADTEAAAIAAWNRRTPEVTP